MPISENQEFIFFFNAEERWRAKLVEPDAHDEANIAETRALDQQSANFFGISVDQLDHIFTDPDYHDIFQLIKSGEADNAADAKNLIAACDALISDHLEADLDARIDRSRTAFDHSPWKFNLDKGSEAEIRSGQPPRRHKTRKRVLALYRAWKAREENQRQTDVSFDAFIQAWQKSQQPDYFPLE